MTERLNSEQAHNKLREIRKNVKKDALARERPGPTIADPRRIAAELCAIIDHYIPEKGNGKLMKVLMKMNVNGASLNEIAYYCGAPLKMVEMLHKIGMEIITKGIEKDPSYRVGEKKIISGKHLDNRG